MIRKKSIGKTIALVFLILWAFFSLFPMYYMFQMSITPQEQINSVEFNFFPDEITIENYETLFGGVDWGNFFFQSNIVRWFINSLFICGMVTVMVLLFCSMAGYGFAKKEFPLKNVMFVMLIMSILVPPQVTLVPIYIMMRRLGILNTLSAVILPGTANVFGVFMMRQFLSTVSNDYMDAARLDGANEWQIFWHVVLPLVKPAIAVLAIFTFIQQWNSYLWPLIALSDPVKYPLTVGLATLQSQNMMDYGLQAAGAVISAIPMIIVFLSLQDYFIKGATLGGKKG